MAANPPPACPDHCGTCDTCAGQLVLAPTKTPARAAWGRRGSFGFMVSEVLVRGRPALVPGLGTGSTSGGGRGQLLAGAGRAGGAGGRHTGHAQDCAPASHLPVLAQPSGISARRRWEPWVQPHPQSPQPTVTLGTCQLNPTATRIGTALGDGLCALLEVHGMQCHPPPGRRAQQRPPREGPGLPTAT